MCSLLPLPSISTGSASRSPNVTRSVDQLRQTYFTTKSMLVSSDFELQRVRFHQDAIIKQSFPNLAALEEVARDESIPQEWLHDAAQKFSSLLLELFKAESHIQGKDSATSRIPEVITLERTGRRGRPRKCINPTFLRDAMDPHRNIYVSKLASKLNISENTLRREIRLLGIEKGYSKIPDQALDQVIRDFLQRRDHTTGSGYVIGHVRRKGIRVQRHRIRAAISRVDRVGQTMRRNERAKIPRRSYHVPRPNALWHMDGHHKLIAWGIIIHGCIDGYSRTITGIRASTNNRPSTVLELFLDAILAYGIPSRVRGDRGGENRDVAILMILLRGLHRASYMWGSSTHNSRIERLWVEIGTQFARRWRAFFLRLEKFHYLNRADPHHLWLLHFLFLNDINHDCEEFRQDWNSHPLSGRGKGGNQSPNDIRLLGQLEYGVYDDYDSVPVSTLETHYGVYGNITNRTPGRTGAGHPADEESEEESGDEEADWVDIDGTEEVIAETTLNMHAEPVPVPEHNNPFSSHSSNAMRVFELMLTHYQSSNHIPSGFGMLPIEWDTGFYPTSQVIPSGRRGSRQLEIGLPEAIWRPRSEKWVQALDIMMKMKNLEE